MAKCRFFSVSSFFLVSLKIYIVFRAYFRTITVSCLYGEYVVRFFLPPGVVFLYVVTTGWIFDISLFKAVVKYVGGFWPIGVFFAGYRSFFFVPSRQTQTKARL